MHGQRRRDGDALAFAAREGIDPAAPQRVDTDLIDHFLDALSHQRPREPQVLETKGKLRLNVLEHELRFRMLKDEADVDPELSWRVLPRVEAAHDHPSTELAAGAVRDEAVQAAKQRGLSATRGATQQDHLARLARGR